jgi:restriction system protein
VGAANSARVDFGRGNFKGKRDADDALANGASRNFSTTIASGYQSAPITAYFSEICFIGRCGAVITSQRGHTQRLPPLQVSIICGELLMARRKKTTFLEDLIDLVALLPWWLGVVLAIVSYFVLHALSGPDVPAPANLNQIGATLVHVVWKAFATAGQYLLPFACLIGAATSAWQRRKRSKLVSHVADSDAADALHGMSWQEFEITVSEAFRLDGFRVEERGGAGADGGIDLVLYREREKFLVQCKQWKAYQVGVGVVRELYGVMAAQGAAGGFVVTSGRFTKDAVEFAEGRNVVLIDGAILFDMIKHAKSVSTVGSHVWGVGAAAQDCARMCPVCGGAMVKRVAKRGANVGKAFWGCSTFPVCAGTRSIG